MVCNIRPAHEMPINDWGDRVDIAIYGKGAIARLNGGQFYEHLFTATCRDVMKDIREMLAKGKESEAKAHMETALSILSPILHSSFVEATEAEQKEFIDECVATRLRPVIPAGVLDDPKHAADSQPFDLSIVDKILAFRPPNRGKLTYIDETGVKRRTRTDTLVGQQYIITLDKLDHKPMAVSGVVRQHHGLPASQNKGTRHANPSKEKGARVFGETEVRSGCAVMGPVQMAELQDLATNPEAHRQVIRSLLTSESPSNIDNLVDRNKVPIGGRTLQFIRHLFKCAGIDIVKG